MTEVFARLGWLKKLAGGRLAWLKHSPLFHHLLICGFAFAHLFPQMSFSACLFVLENYCPCVSVCVTSSRLVLLLHRGMSLMKWMEGGELRTYFYPIYSKLAKTGQNRAEKPQSISTPCSSVPLLPRRNFSAVLVACF